MAANFMHSDDDKNRTERGFDDLRRNHLFNAVLNNTPDLAYVFDLQHRFIYANEGLLRMWGKTWEEARGKTCLELGYEPWHADMHGREIDQVARTKQSFRGQVPFNGTFGRRIYDYILVPVLDADGNVEAVAGTTRDVTEQRNGEDALRRSELFSRSIIESSRDCIKTLDLAGKVTWINDYGVKTLCFESPESVIGEVWVDFWSGENRERAELAIQSALNGDPRHFVGSLVINKVTQWWDVLVTPMRASSGIESLLVVSRNITDNLRAQELSSIHSAMVESSDDAIVTKSLQGMIRTWNFGAEKMFGYAAADVIGKHISILFPAERIPEEEEIISRIQRGERIEHFETVRLRRDGKPISVSLAISPIKDSDGSIIGVSKIARDITQQRRETQLLKDRTRYCEILNKTGQTIASELDLEKVVQIVTDAGTQLCGAQFGAFFYNSVKENGESFVLFSLSGAPREAFEKLGLPRNTPVFNPTFRGEGVVRSGDITEDLRYGTMEPHFGMPKGHLPVRSYLAVPVVSRSGEVIGGLFFGHPERDRFDEFSEKLVVGIAAQAAVGIDNARLYEAKSLEIASRKSIEEKLKAAKEEAERANRAKDEFLAIVSHELRTPLTSILGWTNILTNTALPEDKRRQGIAVIERNARLQTQLIEDLLDISRIITGKLTLSMQSVRIGQPIAAAIESVKQAVDAKRIQIDFSQEDEDQTITGDPGRLQQVFWNLLANAVKFTPKNGTITIRQTKQDSKICVIVSDTGKGIAPEFIPHIFERFRQGDSATTRTFGGLGLGLAIVRYLVEQHGGTVDAYSEGINKGSTFTVELPIHAVVPSTAPKLVLTEDPSTAAVRPLQGVRILVVEDDADSRDLLTLILEGAGAVCVACSDAERAFAEVRRRPPTLIISDIGMPGEDGYSFIDRVRKLPLEIQPPAIALTAFARKEDRDRAIKAGFDLHLSKPMEAPILVEQALACIVSRNG